MSIPESFYSDESVTLYHGDCLEIDAWLEADVLIIDPPYGSQAMAGRYGRRQNGGRTIANDLTTELRDEILTRWGDRPVACFGTPRMAEPPGDWTDRLVWDKREPGLNGGPWRYTHESIFVRGEGWHRTSASSFSVISIPSGNGSPEKADHVHAKPISLMERLVASAPDGVIADATAGSGPTLIAARNLGRLAIGVEYEERHCQTIVKRLSQNVLDFGAVS